MWKIGVIISLMGSASALIAYDCGHEKINKTVISLLNVEPCNIENPSIKYEEEDIQLLELNEVTLVHIYQCKINILQSVYHCGMFSHLSVVPGGLSTFIMDISKEDCIKIQQFGTLRLQNNKIIEGIKTNSSTRVTEVVAGTVDTNGNCQGTSYTYGQSSWNDVIVIHAMEVTIMDYDGNARLNDDEIMLRNNLVCPYMKGRCVDPEYGISFWNLLTDSGCEAIAYNVLYQGNATKAHSLDIYRKEAHTIYTVSTGEIIFALETVKPISVCHYEGYQTEHPRLVIVKKARHGYPFIKKPTNTKGLDLFTYINAKFVYVERHIKAQIQTLYLNLLKRKCELEREVLKTQLIVAHQHPTEFALMRMKEPGYTAISRGEVLYIIKCQAVEVTIRKPERCFSELPVTYQNRSFFIAPITHLLQEYGTEIPCSSILTSSYFLHGTWYGFSPQTHRLETPELLKPSEEIPWKYQDPHDLIKSGIYSFESVNELRKQIMYPSERRAIENIVTKTLVGHDIDQQDINILHLFSNHHFSKISDYLIQTWSAFSTLGQVSAGFIGLWLIIRLVKYLVGVVINAKLISTLRGKSWWLLAATCNTLTTYLVHKELRQSRQEPDIQLTSILTESRQQATEETNEVSAKEDRELSSSTITLDTLQRQTRIYPSLTSKQ